MKFLGNWTEKFLSFEFFLTFFGQRESFFLCLFLNLYSNQICAADTVCIDPLTACRGGICSCVTGKSNGIQCDPVCPDGSVAGTTCKKLFDGFPQIIDASDKTDTCPNGQQCITWGSPLVGRCCPISCPYGTSITGRSCQPSATNPCEDENYYCYKIQVRNKNHFQLILVNHFDAVVLGLKNLFEIQIDSVLKSLQGYSNRFSYVLHLTKFKHRLLRFFSFIGFSAKQMQ